MARGSCPRLRRVACLRSARKECHGAWCDSDGVRLLAAIAARRSAAAFATTEGYMILREVCVAKAAAGVLSYNNQLVPEY